GVSADLAEWLGCAGPGAPFCFGDTPATPCPCVNAGDPGQGCDNSAATGGARLAASGTTHPDTVVLSASRELPTALSIFLQGDANAGFCPPPSGGTFNVTNGVRIVW